MQLRTVLVFLTAAALAACADDRLPTEPRAGDMPTVSEARLILDGGGFEGSAQEAGFPIGWNALPGHGGAVAPSPSTQCIVDGLCSFGTMYFVAPDLGHTFHDLDPIEPDVRFGVASTVNLELSETIAEDFNADSAIVRSTGGLGPTLTLVDFSGSWSLALDYALLWGAGAEPGFEDIAELTMLTDGGATRTSLLRLTPLSTTLFPGVAGPVPVPVSDCGADELPNCTGWLEAGFDMTDLVGTEFQLELRVREMGPGGEPLVDDRVPIAIALANIGLDGVLAASGDEGDGIPLVAPSFVLTAQGSAGRRLEDETGWSWAVSGPGSENCSFDDATLKTPVLTCLDDAELALTVDVQIGSALEFEEYEGTITVANVAPTVGPVTGAPAEPVPLNTTVAIEAAFTDPGVLDTHTAEIDWGDGTVSTLAVPQEDGAGTVSGSHVYATPGVFPIVVTVTDDDGGSDSSLYEYVVVYDPSGGSVTGGGWIDSPAGACALNESCMNATGRATFGFVSRFRPGRTVPDGNTQFQFKAGGIDFKSTAYEWLVVAGARAQFKGSGAIDGAGDYGFLLSAIDGSVNGGGGVDRFRIKIWETDGGQVVYDNQMGDADDAAAATELGGGSIRIHRR
jgi:hypothetical protein